jgi:diguanylate cyclase (GGDEF)-like protein
MTALTTSYSLIAIPNSARAASFRPIVSELARAETIVVRDGDAAMNEIAERGAPGLLIVDLSLPRIDGFALMRSLRGQGGASTRIVAMSAYETLRAAARDLSLPLGIGAVLPLDVEAGTLRDGLTALFSRAQDRGPGPQATLFGAGASDPRSMEADEVIDRAALEIRRRFKMPFSIGYLRVDDHESIATHMSTTDPSGGLAFGDLSDLGFLRQVADAAEPLVVPNVDSHPVYARVGLKGARPFRGFAVVPVATSRPNTKAALCVLDVKPIALTASDIDALAGLARAVGQELDRSILPVMAAPTAPELNGTLTDDVEALQHLASTDPLTGLANRRGGEKHIANEISRARREKRPLSCLLIDIDRFKQVNDTYGHQAGDQLLRDVSGLLRRTVRAYDILIRWGGEEFLIVLPGVDLEAARVLAERVRTAVETLDTHGIGPVTISAGAATFEKDYDFAATLKTADRRLYQAKAAGRNSVA